MIKKITFQQNPVSSLDPADEEAVNIQKQALEAAKLSNFSDLAIICLVRSLIKRKKFYECEELLSAYLKKNGSSKIIQALVGELKKAQANVF